MADYRDITQEYAKGAMKTVVLINAGGVIATLNQFAEITKFASTGSLKCAMTMWIFGIAFGVFSWVAGYASTVGFGNYQETNKDSFHKDGNFYAKIAAITIGLSLFAFIAGCLVIIYSAPTS